MYSALESHALSTEHCECTCPPCPPHRPRRCTGVVAGTDNPCFAAADGLTFCSQTSVVDAAQYLLEQMVGLVSGD